MSLLNSNIRRIISKRFFSLRSILAVPGGDGSGAGHGGGSGGSIREAGGIFGEKEASLENAYFVKLDAEHIKALRNKIEEEIKNHEEQIKIHEKAIERHRALRKQIESEEKK